MGKFIPDHLIPSLDEVSKGTILRSMAICTAIELCGSFLTGKTGKRTTGLNFKSFLESEYIDSRYSKLSELLYEVFRNGVAHAYLPKSGVLLTSDQKQSQNHLKYTQDGVIIHIPTFAAEVKKGIKGWYERLNTEDELMEKYKFVLREMDEDGMSKYKVFLSKNNIKPVTISVQRDIDTNL